MNTRQNYSSRPRQRGLTLVELMISLVLGLIVTGGAISMFIANREVNRATENLSRMQENSRIAFELMARSLRQAGWNSCGALTVVNVLEDSEESGTWWSQAIKGYSSDETIGGIVPFGTKEKQRVEVGAETDSGTTVFSDAIALSMESDSSLLITKHVPASAVMTVTPEENDVKDGDILLVCDTSQAAIFQSVNDTKKLNHNPGASVSPGNCSKGLGYPKDCKGLGTLKDFTGGHVSKLVSEAWYIGNNSRNGTSLFRIEIPINADPDDDATANSIEVVENVTSMELRYKTDDPKYSSDEDDYVPANKIVIVDGIDGWSKVVAVKVELTFVSADKISTASGRPALERKLIHVATLRNRAP